MTGIANLFKQHLKFEIPGDRHPGKNLINFNNNRHIFIKISAVYDTCCMTTLNFDKITF